MNAPHIVAFGNGSFPILVKPCACALTRTLDICTFVWKSCCFRLRRLFP